VGEAIQLVSDGKATVSRIVDLLDKLHISAARHRVTSYPHQLSGGMRQRVVSAMALAGPPEILIADEPTTSLDTTIQAQYLALLREVQAASGVAVLFITHDFGIVAELCDRVAVMYHGRIVELGDAIDIFDRPSHPYTRGLLRSVPRLGASERLWSIPGQPPRGTAQLK